MNVWTRVKHAHECVPCEFCGEPFCLECNDHYADCKCPGPTQDDMIYKTINGIEYATPEEGYEDETT